MKRMEILSLAMSILFSKSQKNFLFFFFKLNSLLAGTFKTKQNQTIVSQKDGEVDKAPTAKPEDLSSVLQRKQGN